MENIERFYNNKHFEQLILTPPFTQYLEEENIKIHDLQAKSLLELGCGSGRLFPLLAKQADQVVGLEIAKRQYQLASTLATSFTNIQVIHGDATKMPFCDNHFCATLMAWNTFGNLGEKRDAVLAEAIRVTKSQEKIYLSILAAEALSPYLEMLKVNNLTVEHITHDLVFLHEGLISERFSRQKLENIFDHFNLNYRVETLTSIGYWCELWKTN